MAKEYRVTPMRRAANRLMAAMVRRGKSASWQLTVTGRSSGERRSVVITPEELDGIKYLIAPYGEVAWVKNIRENPTATLSRGGATMRITATEVTGDEAARVLVRYYASNKKYVGPYMDIPGDKTVTDFLSVSDTFPVFRANPT